MPDEPIDSRDERIGRILNEYLDRTQRGETGFEQELLEAHPDLADELRGHFGMVRQMSSAASHGTSGPAPTIALPHDALPGYEIRGEIHRGGQGVVYHALQEATRREVAVKVMSEGPFAGRHDRARFEREVRLLGALNHPGIVTIHESRTACGYHFFVMDYIAGSPLDVWVSSAPRTVEQVMKTFVTVCDAVNAAHVKGIIHRDLKPGNIRIDEEGRPHILDFGLAKTTGREEEDDEAAGMTMVGQFVGSLPWTSPEQAQGALDDVDTRTDVYALGVVLYQMLTGTFPYEVTGPMRDVLNRIVGDEPNRPGRIRKEVDDEAEAIVLKCLRKEPARRYQTAGELGRDIERYLKGEPIAARSDSGLYVLGKLLRRYRVGVSVAAAFAILIGVSLLVSLSFWRQAVVQRDQAIIARQEQEQQRDRADQKAAEAEQQTYLSKIALARYDCEQKHLTRAQQSLEECPHDLRGWEWHYLSRLAKQPTLLDIRADHANPPCVVALAISRDGERVVTGGCDGIVKVWDGRTGVPIAQLTGHSDRVNAVACSPDGRWIVSGSRDKTLRLWDTRDGSHRVLQTDEQYIHCVSFSSDGSRLVAGGSSRVLTFWDVPGGQVVRRISGHEKEISCVAYGPDGLRVASGEFLNPNVGSAKIRIWDVQTGESVRILDGHPGAVLSVAFSPEGRYLASGGGVSFAASDARGTLKVFDSHTGEEILSLAGHEGFVESVAFSPDGKRLASAGFPHTPASGVASDHTLKIWDSKTGGELCTYSAHNGGGKAVGWSPDARRVSSGGMDGKLKVWPSTPPPRTRVFQGHSSAVLQVAFSPDGKRIVSCSGQSGVSRRADEPSDNTIRLWDLATGSQLRVLDEHKSEVLGVAWSPDGRSIASGGMDRIVRVWDSESGAQQLMFPMPEGAAQSVAFSPEGKLLGAVAGYAVVLWNMPDGSEYRRLWHEHILLTIRFSPDGRWIVTGSEGNLIVVWDRHSGREYRSISTGPGLNGAWFSPDSATIASAHEDGTLCLWDVLTGRQTAAMRGPQRSVEWIDFSPDGRRIASCGADMMLRIWDVPSASEVYSLPAHEAPLTCLRFSPDGRAIATCGQDGLVKIWETRVPPTTQPAITTAGASEGVLEK